MARSLEITVSSACIGSGQCRQLAPDAFGADERHRSVVRHNPVDEDERVWEALESCPVEALSARDAATGEQLFP